MNMDLTGRVAVVTGAGLGLGREISKRLAQNGAKIIANDVMEENVKETVAR